VMRGLTGLASGEGAAVAVYDSDEHIARPLERGEIAIVDRPAIVDGAAIVHGTAPGPGLLPFYWAGAFRGAALVPVHGDNRVQGALCVLSETPGAFGAEESKFLVTAASVLSAGLRRIHSEGRLAFLAQFDALTGLPNRALLADRFSQMIVQARRHAKPLGVLFIDLDDFKLVNDSLGHAGGDELLKETARRLQSSVRAGDTVARISGDEFAVILGDLARPDDAAIVAQKIIDRLAAPVSVRGHEVFVTASIGIAAFPADGSDAEALLGAADAAMYRAKQSGRNAYQFFTADINQRTRARAQLGSELRRALERGEFALAYQPKFDLRSGRPCAAEALLRWRHPERGLVPPVEFIPVLEETGLIVQVGEWVLRRACEDLKAWQAAGLPPMQVAVNLSARQFRQQDLHARIRDLVSAAGVAPEMIELEITESQLMQDPDHAKRVIQALSDGGIGVAIDDFGTGYSSLSYLTRFPVSALKIDRSFVADVLSDRAAAAIVRTIIDMAHTLGFIVIAEGVETEAQALLLRGLGCEQAQGYFFAKPQPEAEFRKLIASYASDSARHQIGGER
jgi:diguanylate cyclase (GGDEF)-like protein